MVNETDSLIMEGLKTAIVEAFFQQQHYYDGNGGVRTYGGTAADLVKQILERKEFKAMLTEISNGLHSHKEQLETMIPTSVVAKAKEDTIKFLNNSSNSWELRDLINRTIADSNRELIKQAVQADPKIQKMVEKKVGKGDWDINITVHVTATEKGE